jgi:hypothetical protein
VSVTVQGGVVQVAPAGGLAEAVLTIAPVALSWAVPVMATVRLSPTPSATDARPIALPVPLAPVPAAVVSQSAVTPLAVQVHQAGDLRADRRGGQRDGGRQHAREAVPAGELGDHRDHADAHHRQRHPADEARGGETLGAGGGEQGAIRAGHGGLRWSGHAR